MRRRGQGSGVARPRSGQRALTLAPFDAGYGRRKRFSWLLAGCDGVRALSSSGTGVPGVRAGGEAAGHPFAAVWRHEAVRRSLVGGVNQRRDHAWWGS